MSSAKVLFLSVLAVMLLAPIKAHALYTTVGSGCVIDPSTADKAAISESKVTFKPTATGQITLICPITYVAGAVSTIELLYEDNASASGNSVGVVYAKANATNGAVTFIKTLSSESGATTSGAATPIAASFADSYDPNNFRYFVRVVLVRNTTTAFVAFHGVSLY